MGLLFEWIEFVGVGFETVAVGNRVKKEEDVKGEESEEGVSAEENEATEAGEILGGEGDGGEADKPGEGELGESDGDIEGKDI